MKEEIKKIVESYRTNRKENIDKVWDKPWNIINRWLNARSGILQQHWSDDFDNSDTDVAVFLQELKDLTPSKKVIEDVKLRLMPNKNMVENRMYYLGIQAAIFAAVLAIVTPHEEIRTGLIFVLGFLGIGFTFERGALSTEKMLAEEINSIFDHYLNTVESE